MEKTLLFRKDFIVLFTSQSLFIFRMHPWVWKIRRPPLSSMRSRLFFTWQLSLHALPWGNHHNISRGMEMRYVPKYQLIYIWYKMCILKYNSLGKTKKNSIIHEFHQDWFIWLLKHLLYLLKANHITSDSVLACLWKINWNLWLLHNDFFLQFEALLP